MTSQRAERVKKSLNKCYIIWLLCNTKSSQLLLPAMLRWQPTQWHSSVWDTSCSPKSYSRLPRKSAKEKKNNLRTDDWPTDYPGVDTHACSVSGALLRPIVGSVCSVIYNTAKHLATHIGSSGWQYSNKSGSPTPASEETIVLYHITASMHPNPRSNKASGAHGNIHEDKFRWTQTIWLVFVLCYWVILFLIRPIILTL